MSIFLCCAMIIKNTAGLSLPEQRQQNQRLMPSWIGVPHLSPRSNYCLIDLRISKMRFFLEFSKRFTYTSSSHDAVLSRVQCGHRANWKRTLVGGQFRSFGIATETRPITTVGSTVPKCDKQCTFFSAQKYSIKYGMHRKETVFFDTYLLFHYILYTFHIDWRTKKMLWISMHGFSK